MPSSAVIVSFVDFAISMVLFAILMAIYRVVPGWPVLLLPVFTLLAMNGTHVAEVAVFHVQRRQPDARAGGGEAYSSGFYLSPVGFSSSIVPAKWQLLYAFKPDGRSDRRLPLSISRGETPFPLQSLALSSLTVAFLLCISIWYFRKRNALLRV